MYSLKRVHYQVHDPRLQIERREIYILQWETIISLKLVNSNNNNTNSKITACLIILTEVSLDQG